MRIAVLGTGTVGQTLAGGLDAAGHDVAIGTRDPAATLARTEPDRLGAPPMAQWLEDHPGVELLAFREVGAHGEVVVNATSGSASLAALAAVGDADLDGKVLLDAANPLDFSQGYPPTLTVANTDSLAEQVQRAHPGARVVKSLNTINAALMVSPDRVPGDHTMFVAGEDDDAKATVVGLLGDLGWPAGRILDLGGIRSARGMEMYLPLWLALASAAGTTDVSIRVLHAE